MMSNTVELMPRRTPKSEDMSVPPTRMFRIRSLYGSSILRNRSSSWVRDSLKATSGPSSIGIPYSLTPRRLFTSVRVRNTPRAFLLLNFGKLKPVSTDACFLVMRAAKLLNCSGLRTRTKMSGMSLMVIFPASIWSAKKSIVSRMFCSATGRSSSLMASSQHITNDVTGNSRLITLARMSFVPGIYSVAPRQY